MRCFIYERDLLWSVRLKNAFTALGHDAIVIGDSEPTEAPDLAIVNLASNAWPLETLMRRLQSQGVIVIGHAGHKEKHLHELGANLGCDILATNSELAHKLANLTEKANQVKQSRP